MRKTTRLFLVFIVMMFALGLSAYADETQEGIHISNYEIDTITMQNNSGENDVMYAAWYQDGLLSRISKSEIGGDTVELSTEDISYYESYTVKAFCWDKDTMKPAATPMTASASKYRAEDFDEAKSDISSGVLYFYRGNTTLSIKHQISKDAIYYVNGVATEISKNEDIIGLPNGYVTLLKTRKGSDIDTVLITTYSTAVVEEVTDNASDIQISFVNKTDDLAATMNISKGTDDISYKFIYNGNEIAPNEIQPYDVLSIAYDRKAGFAESDFYKVYVSRNNLTGKVIGSSSAGIEYVIRYQIDDAVQQKKYNIADQMGISMDISITYTIYFDHFGKIAEVDEIKDMSAAIFEGIYQKANGDYIAEITNQYGSKIECIIDESNLQAYGEIVYETFNSIETKGNKKPVQDRVIDYKMSASNKFYVINNVAYEYTECIDEKYSDTSKTIGDCVISEETDMLDISDTEYYKQIDTENLKDGENYTAYAYCKINKDSIYKFIIITEGMVLDYGHGVIESVNDGVATMYKDGNIEEFVINDSIKEAIENIMEKPIEERIVYYTIGHGEIIDVKSISGSEHKGVYERKMIDGYGISTSGCVNYLNDGKIDFISDRCLMPEIEYTVNIYRYNRRTFALLTDGQIDESLAVEIGVLDNVYEKLNGDYGAEIIGENGEKQDYNINYNQYIEYKDQVEKPVEERIVTYKYSNNKLTELENISADEKNGTYDASTKSIGDVHISDSMTTLLYENEYGDIMTYDASSLKNQSDYKVYAFGEIITGDSRIVLVKSGMLQTFKIGILSETTDEFTVYDHLVGDELTYAPELQEKIEELALKEIGERVINYVVTQDNIIVEIEELESVQSKGYYENDHIGDYHVLNDIIYINSDGLINTLDIRCLLKEEEYTLSVYSKNNKSVAILTDGQIDENGIYEMGILATVYQKANGDYIAEVISDRGISNDFKIDNSDVQNCKDIIADMEIQNRVIRYYLDSQNDFEIVLTYFDGEASNEIPVSAGNNGLGVYDKETGSIGQLKIRNNTKILDVSNYKNGHFRAVSADTLTDGYQYIAYGYGQLNNDESCRFIIVSEPVPEFDSTTQLAIYEDRYIDIDSNGEQREACTIYIDSEKHELMFDDDVTLDKYLTIGDPVIINTNAKGYITGIKSVFEDTTLLEDNTYESFRDYALNCDNIFLSELGVDLSTGKSELLSDKSDEVELVFGPIIDRTNAEITIGKVTKDGDNYTTDLENGAKVIEVTSDTKVYTYDYGINPSLFSRIIMDNGIIATNIPAAAIDNNEINLSHEEVFDNIVFGLARIIDGDVQEIYLIVSE